MKHHLTFSILTIWFVIAVLLSNAVYAQKEKYLLEECYNFHHFSNSNLWVSKYMFNMLVADDFVLKGGVDAGDSPELGEIDNFLLTPMSAAPLEIWKVYYNGIEKSNNALAYIPDITENKGFRAEAKFIRAYCYFNLVRLFGGVPLITEDCSPGFTNIPRATTDEVYELIKQDMTEALVNLPEKSALAATGKYKATQGAAHAVYAQSCLYQQKWSDAATHLSAIINSGQYALLANYSDLWLVANEHNAESVYEFEYYNDKQYSWGTLNWASPESNLLVQLFGPRMEEVTITNTAYNYGWGFGQVTQNLVDLFNSQGDIIRKNETILGLSEIGIQVNPGYYEFTGYKSKKYTTRKANTCNPAVAQPELNYGQNIVEIRYADVLLMYAEAQARMGNNAEAIKYVNMVRTRAGLPGLNTELSTEALLDAIFMERTLEFALEGKRFLDIVRWGKWQSIFGSHGYDDHYSIWPIPAQIIAANPNMVQNPGYSGESVTPVAITPQINEYAPSASFPWIKNTPAKVLPYFMEQYKYNYCMDDSVLNAKASYSYNDKNLMNGYVEATANELQIYKETYTYDNNDRLTRLVRLQNTTTNWDTIQVNYFRYPGTNMLIDSLGFYSGGAPNGFTVSHYNWNEAENYYRNSYANWFKSGSDVFVKDTYSESETKTILSYNQGNRIINELTKRYNKNSGIWGDSIEIDNEYSNDNLIKRDGFKISSAKTMTSETLFEYDINNKLASEKNYQLTDNGLNVSNGTLYNYGNSSYGIVKTPLQYLSLVEDLHHIRERRFFDFNKVNTNVVTNALSDEGVLIYSNPSAGLFHVKVNAGGVTHIKVYNPEGGLVINQDVDIRGGQIFPLDLTGKSKGIYFLQLLTDKKTLQVKLILQ